MKLQKLYVSQFLGTHCVDVDMSAAVQVFAGPNGAGKSSLRDAVALALTGDLGRISLKKEAAQLIREGGDNAVCSLVTSDQDEYTATINAAGKITCGKLPDEPALPYVLDAQRFAHLDANARRSFLFGLMGVKMDGPAVKQRLLSKGCDSAKVERVAPMLRAGFEAACKEAKAKATEAKGAWSALTGETYGSEKAKSWTATVPEHDAATLKALNTSMKACDTALDSWLLEVGKLQTQEKRRNEIKAKLQGLKDHAARIERIQAKLDKDSKELAEWEADLAKTQAAASGGQRVGLIHELAWAVDNLIIHSGPLGDDGYDGRIKAALHAYELEFGKVNRSDDAVADQGAMARLPNITKSRDLMANAVANSKRDLQAAQQAATEVDVIEKELAADFDEKALTEARGHVEKMKIERAELVKKLDAQSSLKKQAEAAEQKTKDALVHHDDVTQWDQIADALAPDGIPGDILSEALGPINDRLDQSAADTAWPRVLIDADMGITGDGRDYRLLSESEQWRVDAMLAEAVAHLSGMSLLVLDRFDVLDIGARSQLLSWLDVLADLGEIHTALVFGTLKALPSNLPQTIAAHWIENGAVVQLKEAA